MFDALRYGALILVALAALGALGLIVYNFVENDWRLEGNPFSVLGWFESEEDELAGPSALDEATRTQAHRFRADSAQRISIDVDHLRVRVSRADVSRILVQFMLNSDAADTSRFSARAWRDSAGILRITGTARADTGDFRGELIVSLPGPVRLSVRSSATTVLSDIEGFVEAESRDGIEASGISGVVRLRSTRGPLSLSGSMVTGEIRADSGEVRTSFTDGAIVVRSGAGLIASRHFGSLDVRCDAHIAVELASPDVGATLVSTRGDVVLRVLPTGSFDFDVRAPSGFVTANLVLDTVRSALSDRRRLDASINGGGHRVRIRTDSGNVDISPFGRDELGSSAAGSGIRFATNPGPMVRPFVVRSRRRRSC